MLASILETYKLPTNLAKTTEELVLPSTIKHTAFKAPKEYVSTLYTDDEQTPVWFATRSNELVPTVYTMWKAPFILPKVRTHPHVIEVLIGGADLMLPGCIPPFGEIHEGDIVGICDSENPDRVMAVGRANRDLSRVEKCVGTTGIAVKVMHRVEDVVCLVTKKKIEVPETVGVEMEFKDEPKDETDNTSESTETTEPTESTEMEEAQDPEQSAVDNLNTLTIEDIDHFFQRSLFQTLTQSTIIPPLNSSNFMDHIVQNLPLDHPQIQIKRTSWKKSAKFLKAMEKDGFLRLKGKGDDLVVVGVASKENNDHLKNFVPYKIKKRVVTDSRPKESSNQLILSKFFKGTSPVRQVFNSLDLDFTQYYTTNELREILNKYISKENLVNEKNKKNIVIDDVLAKIIPGQDTTVGRDKIFPPFLSRFSEFYTLTKPGQKSKAKILKGSPPKVNIVTETKIGRKVITRVFNFQHYDIDPEELSMELKLKCSGSSTIQPNVQNPKVIEVLVQGSHALKVVELLTKKYGLHVSWIDSEDKSKKKKK